MTKHVPCRHFLFVRVALNSNITKHTLGNGVALTDATPFVCPSDGYVSFDSNGETYCILYAVVNGTSIPLMTTYKGNYDQSDTLTTFVRKGMTILLNGAGARGFFYPLT